MTRHPIGAKPTRFSAPDRCPRASSGPAGCRHGGRGAWRRRGADMPLHVDPPRSTVRSMKVTRGVVVSDRRHALAPPARAVIPRGAHVSGRSGGWAVALVAGTSACCRRHPERPFAAPDCVLKSKQLLFRMCAVGVPLTQGSGGTPARSRPFIPSSHVRSHQNGRTNTGRKAGLKRGSKKRRLTKNPLLKRGSKNPLLKRGVEARRDEESAVEAGHHPAVEPPSHVLGVNPVWSPQHRQEGEGSDTQDQESPSHDRPPLVRSGSGPHGPDGPRSIRSPREARANRARAPLDKASRVPAGATDRGFGPRCLVGKGLRRGFTGRTCGDAGALTISANHRIGAKPTRFSAPDARSPANG